MPNTDGRTREHLPPRIPAWWFSLLLPFPLGVVRAEARYGCTRDHHRAWEQAQAVRRLLPVLREIGGMGRPRSDVRRVASRIGVATTAPSRFRADHVALREFLLGHTLMQDDIQEAWWAAFRSSPHFPQGRRGARNAADKWELSITDSWLFYDHNHIVQWPPFGEQSGAASNRRYGYPAFIDSVTTDLMLQFRYQCYCHALQHHHSRLGELLPSTAAQAWTSGNGWRVGEKAVGLLLDMAGVDGTAPEGRRLDSLQRHRPYEIVADRLSSFRRHRTH